MLAAASRPSRIAQTTSEAPRTMSPAAKTPSRLVIMVRKSILTVPQRVTSSSRRAEQRRQVLGIEAQRLDDQVGVEAEVEPGIVLRRLAAGGVGRAQPHARRAHAASTVAVADERLGRREPDELDALLLGVRTSRFEPGMLARSRR